VGQIFLSLETLALTVHYGVQIATSARSDSATA